MIYGGLLRCCLLVLKELAKKRVSITEKHLIHRIDSKSEICSRIPKIIELCQNKAILHIGFADSPFTEKKIISKELLHLQLKKNSPYIFGIDSDRNAVDLYSKLTGDSNVVPASVYSLKEISLQYNRFEVILLAEVLEHLGNPLQALQSIQEISNGMTQLIITVPNAFRLSGFNHALYNIEAVHNDHFAWYSPYTLKNLLKSAGFISKEMYFYTNHNGSSAKFYLNRQLLSDGIIGVFKKA